MRRARFGPRPALVDPDGSRVTYEELDQRSDEVAAGMLASGLAAGDVVLLQLPSDSAYVVAYAAAAKVGAITAGVNPRLAPPEQQAVARGGRLRPHARLRRRGRRAAPPGPDPAARRRSRPASRAGVHVRHHG